MAQTLGYNNTNNDSLYKLNQETLKKTIKIADRHLLATTRGSLERLQADQNTFWIEEVDIASKTITYRIVEIGCQPGNPTNIEIGDPLSK